ncbi:protein Njmu-R1-like isoform X2 [Ornithodoros turicata]|uniref:protein Njmu-R1-like isoform X2 n=1 Tax=Ornithodoros turicata TaxID=34597 RepID=UPI003138E63E
MTESAGYESSASNQSIPSATSIDRGTFYAVYLYSNNSLKSQVGEDGGTCDVTSRADDPAKKCLSLLATDLGAASETDLRCYLLKKVARDLQDSRGNIDIVELSMGDKVSTPMACLHQAFWKDTTLENKDHHAYVLCFVAADDGTLDLFYSDVEAFGRALVPSLTNAESDFQQALRENMENWYHICVSYISRCLKGLGENVATLLHCALSDGIVDINIANPEERGDFQRFVDVCKLDVLDSSNSTSSEKAKCTDGLERPNLEIRTGSDGIELSHTETSPFCQRWAKAIFKEDLDNALLQRRIIEGFKIKTIQDMNLIKRLVKQAENDHYALYNAFRFLKECGYSDTLLRRATREGSVTATTEGRDVVTLLSEHLVDARKSITSC